MEDDFNFVRSIFKSSPVYYGAVDIKSNELIYSSDLAKTILHYSKEQMQEFARKDFEKILHPDDLPKLKNAKQKLIESADGEVIKTIVRMKRSDGKYLHIQLNDTVYERDDKSVPVKFSTVAEDITAEAGLKEELEKYLTIIEKVNYKNSHALRGPVSSLMGLTNLIDVTSFKSEYHHKILICLKKTVGKLDSIIHEINEHTTPKP